MGDKPVFRVAAIGLEQRELRLIEIVFRHSQYNSNQYQLADPGDSHFDLLVANVFDPEGRQAAQVISPFGSASLDEASPHYADQAPLFAGEAWRTALLTKPEVEADATRRYRPGKD